jgi:acyl-CoA synthetase (AMP-forming)/AMP-acid ligase II
MYKELREARAELTAAGQMFEVSEITVGGQQVKAWTHAPASLRDMWANTAANADKDYLVYGEERWTYAQASESINRIANWLSQHGVKQHDRVAINMRNYPEWMLCYWAITSMGATVVGMNAWWVADEIDYALKDSSPVVLICDAERLARFDTIRSDYPDLSVVAVRCDEAPEYVTDWADVLQAAPELPDASIAPDDDACIFYTSGTTGRPKGAQLTHRSCTNNVLSMLFGNLVQGAALAKAGTPAPENPNAPEQIAAMIATPLFHVTANNCVAQTATAAGGKLVLLHKWNPSEALRLIAEEKVTNFSGVPVMVREIVNHPEFDSFDTSSLGALGGGGATVQPDLVDKVHKKTNAAPGQGFGMTEASGIICASSGAFFVEKPASVGMAMPVYDIKCVDEQGKALPNGEIGEICIKGAQVIKGYLNRPESTADSIVDGWLHTGDVGYIDEDEFVFLVDRAKDMVIRGGENIYSNEVEAVLFHHDAIAECAVFAVPDERLGEEVGVAIYFKPGQSADAEALRAFCAEKLAAFKIPRYIWIMSDPLPRNANGKFVKRTMQEALQVSDAL